MTKRHFEAIAALIDAEQAQYGEHSSERLAVRDVAIRLAVQFNIENPQFDRAMFLTACGFNGKVLS